MCGRMQCGCDRGCGCGCGCDRDRDHGCGGAGVGGIGGVRPTCGWAYLCQFPNTLAEPLPAFLRETGLFAEEAVGFG